MRTWMPVCVLLVACSGEFAGDPTPDAMTDTGSGDSSVEPDTNAEFDSGIDAAADASSDTLVVDAGTDSGEEDAGAEDTSPMLDPDAIYVATDGDDDNDGRSLETPLRTVLAATQRAVAGETIYVAAGDYGAEVIEFANDGTEDEPITLEGYGVVPGDRPVRSDFDHESVVDARIMPLLDGGDRDSETGISLGGRSYIVVRNFQVTNYQLGVYAYGADHVTVEDMFLTTFGVNEESAYSGKGIIFGSRASFNVARNSVVVNAGAEGIMLYGDDNMITGCRVYGSDSGGSNNNPPDYYMMIKGDRNIIEDSSVFRVGDLSHGGHGIGIKGNGTDNIIRDCVADGFAGSPFYARHRNVIGNMFTGNLARNGGLGMTFRDGASNNVVENFRAEGTRAGVMFFDTTEDEGRQFSGNDNVVRNSTFVDLTGAAIWLHDYTFDDVYARRNVIEDVTIERSPLLFDVRSFGQENILRNSTINNVRAYVSSRAPRVDADLGFTLSGNTGTGNGFDL